MTEQFIKSVQAAGGKAVVLPEGADPASFIGEMYPGVELTCNFLPGCKNPDDVENPAELNGTQVAVVRGVLGVAENGAVWIEKNVRHRALYFISETLVLVLDRNMVVADMHEAYRILEGRDYSYGVFISGPSKTADIEQALVFGAHGARDLTVVLV